VKDGVFDEVTFLTMMDRASKNGDVRRLKEYLEIMQVVGIKPNVQHYYVLLNFYCNQRNDEQFMDLYNEMQKKGIDDIVSRNVYLKFLLENDRIEEVDKELQQMINNGMVNSNTFESLIQVATRKHLLGRVEEYLVLMEKLGVESSKSGKYFWGNVYQHFGYSDEVSYYDKQGGIFHPSNLSDFGKLKEEFKEYCKLENFQSMEKVHFSISRTLRKLRDWNAYEFFEFVRHSLKIEPDDYAFQEIFVILCLHNRFEEAERIFQEILSCKRLSIKSVNYRLLYLMEFPGIVKENCLEKIREVFGYFEKYLWLKMDRLTLSHSIRLCLRFGYIEEALKYFDKFEVYKLKPNLESCLIILDYSKRHGFDHEVSLTKVKEAGKQMVSDDSIGNKSNDYDKLQRLQKLLEI